MMNYKSMLLGLMATVASSSHSLLRLAQVSP